MNIHGSHCGLAHVVIGRDKSGKPLTYRDVFELVYGEPLEPKTSHSAASSRLGG